MPRTLSLPLSATLLALALVACGTDDSKSGTAKPTPAAAEKTAAHAEPAKTDTAKVEPPKSEKPTPAPAAAAAEKPTDKPTEKPADAPKATPPAPAPAADPAIATMRAFIATQKIDKTAKNWKTTVTQPPKLTFDPARKYFWVLNTTEGEIKVRLMPDIAPMHVSSTIYLTELGFYDDLLFHRVIPGFMAQGGDPVGNGTGGPAYKYAGEFSNTVSHTKPGMLSMANAGPGTDGSQFFLTFVPTTFLDGKHTIFGEVAEGLDNLMKLEKSGSQSGKTSKVLKIESAKIVVQ